MNEEKLEFKFMKADFKSLSEKGSDQTRGVKMPSIQKESGSSEVVYELPSIKNVTLVNPEVLRCLQGRRSQRDLGSKSISPESLSFMLWFTQGVQRVFRRSEDVSVTIRTVPSAGARHPFETYLFLNRVDGFKRGVYRYIPLDHKLAHITDLTVTEEEITAAANGQEFVGKANVVFVWCAMPYRTSWRYGSESGKLILLDAGHVCQNLYITAEALGLGTCGIAAYDQTLFDNLLKLDGKNEFVVYLAPVGSIK